MVTTQNRVTIGTAADCGVRVVGDDALYVSAYHAEVWRDAAGQMWIVDLASTNGTYVGLVGRAWTEAVRVVAPRRLVPGMAIWLGMRVCIPWHPRAGGTP